MSAIGNKIKAGFFATPERQGEYIRSILNFNNDTAVFDPTCGEGSILKQLTEAREPRDFTIHTYGVELDKRRAQKARESLDTVVESPIEAMVISHEVFGMVFLNPPYDNTMMGFGDDKTDRKEYVELVRSTKYLKPHGKMIFIIPSYRFADPKIARFLSTNFEMGHIARFSDEDYDDFRQCVFMGSKKDSAFKGFNPYFYEKLLKLSDEDYVKEHVTPINELATSVNKFQGEVRYTVISANPSIPTFYSRIENKRDLVESIRTNKGFEAFIARTRPKELVIAGDPIINIAQGQNALLLASGGVNGLIGEGDSLHAVQGMEIVSKEVNEEITETETIIKTRTKRKVSVKCITPAGRVIKLV